MFPFFIVPAFLSMSVFLPMQWEKSVNLLVEEEVCLGTT